MEIFECTHKGTLKLGEKEIACAVLSNGKRIITQTALFDAFDRPRKGERRLENLPSVIGAKNLLPYISDELQEKSQVIKYYTSGNKIAVGYDAEIIPLICEVYLKAADDGILISSQQNIEVRANILVRSLAKVGITALIDEATGFQYEREADGLQKLLERYVSEDFLAWQARFPRNYYKQLYRIYGWEYNPHSCKRPQYLGQFTNKYVYEYLPEGILEELRKKNPSNEKGSRSRKHHQHLSGDFGVPHLEKHIHKLITIMELSDNPDHFKKNFDRVFENQSQTELNLE
jgi:hypothetical protein